MRRTRRHDLAIVLCTGLLTTSIPAWGAGGPGAPAFAAMRAAWADGDLDAAIRKAEAALSAEPNNVEYLSAVGALYGDKARKASIFTQLSWAKKCRTTWERAALLAPKDVDVKMNLVLYDIHAPGIAGGGLDKARALAREVAALDAVRGEIAFGEIARAEKNLPEAEAHYRKALALDAAGRRGPAALASFLAGQKRWGDARGVFEARLEKNPEDRFAAFQLARLTMLEAADVARALPLFDRYLSAPAPEDGPTHADAHWRKGQCLEKLGRKDEAVKEWEAARALEPQHLGASRDLRRVRP